MSQDEHSISTNNFDKTQFFLGAPSKEEIMNYFMVQKRKADLRVLETTPDVESSPELSESFEMYLQQRKQKVSDEKLKLAAATRGYQESPKTTKVELSCQTTLNETLGEPDDTLMQCSEESFLAMEKMCENTLHLNNVSENLIDLTGMDMSMVNLRKSLKQLPILEETNLDSVEAPSFMFNNTTLSSPLKHSPLIVSNANRPSTILEVSEMSTLNKTNMTSYQTAYTRNGTEASSGSEYKTANEASFDDEGDSIEESQAQAVEECMIIPLVPKIRSFYNDIEDLTKDSLEATQSDRYKDMTEDSLNAGSYVSESSSGVDSSYDQRNDSQSRAASGENLNDTLEQIEFMLEQAKKMQDCQNTPKSPVTPCKSHAKLSMKPLASTTHSPLMKKVTAAKCSPLIKFSPVAKKTPVEPTFKRPINSTLKIPQTATSSSKKFLHVQSPVLRYIKDTPGMPLSSTVRSYHGIGKSPKHFNFRDSEKFSNENDSMNASTSKGSSLPSLAKTKSSAKPHVFDQRETKKTPGGKKIHDLLTFTSPTVTKHQGHIQTEERPKGLQNSLFEETAISEQSFADLSLISGDVSLQVVEAAKRLHK